MRRFLLAAAVFALPFVFADEALARDWYVSVATGKGKKGTIEKPAKDLGNIVTKIEAGDRVHIAEGVYLGRGESGTTQIVVPVEIYGGYSQDFKARDPWGAHKTILSGSNTSENFNTGIRLSVDCSKWRQNAAHKIVVDGIIVDNGDRNRYVEDKDLKIIRKGASGKMPSPESGGISVAAWKLGDIVVRNCVVVNTAPTGGAIAVWGHQKSKCTVENNLSINNTGYGFALHTSFTGADVPQFTFNNNTSLFTEKYDAFGTIAGSALKLESSTTVAGDGNVLGCSDYYGIDNEKRSKDLEMTNTLFAGNLVADYLEFNMKMDVDDIEDESDLIDDAEGCLTGEISVPVSKEWSAAFASRNIIDRNAAETDVKVHMTRENVLRRILGLNLVGTDLKVDSAVWLPRLSLAEALAAGEKKYLGKYGCQKPAPSKGPQAE